MIRKVYYRFVLRAESAFSVGASASLSTDTDVAVDGCGRPFIPASSLAGALRHALTPSEAAAVFGSLDGENSLVKVYDACLLGDANVSVRDNVALDKHDKIAIEGAKFDRQVVDAGAQFRGLLEIDGSTLGIKAEETIEQLLAQIHAGSIRIGSKTTRGLGRMRLVDDGYQKLAFDSNQVDEWLEFDPFEASAWEGAEFRPAVAGPASGAVFDLDLQVVGALSIRRYTTDVTRGQETAPDYEQLTLSATREPIIPGTSWAGAFRAAYRDIADDEDALFGHVGQTAQKSRISFSESIVKGSQQKLYTRNAIDRYTGGTIDGALFTERTFYGGTTTLQIRIVDPKVQWVAAISAAIADLHNGLLAVGGLTAVGHGLFKVSKANLTIDGESVSSFEHAFNDDLARPDLPVISREAGELLNGGE